jgi:uncharacterized repeat protein (TIGR03803 family)
MKTPRHGWSWVGGQAFNLGLIALLASLALPASATTYYVDESVGNNSYDGLSAVVGGGDGPKLNVSAAIAVASSGSTIVVGAGYYAETEWDSGTDVLTLEPQGVVNICGADLCGADSVGDGIPDWWRLDYFGTPTTTNASSCASCDPAGDGFTNFQKYQSGISPLVAYSINAPSMVISYSAGNPASVADLGNGASYSWSIDNGTITSATDTPTITWTAGDTGVAALNVAVQSANPGSSPLGLNASVSVTPCSLSAVILTPPEVRVLSTNIASVPSPMTILYSFTNGVDGANPMELMQATGLYSNFYGTAGAGGTNGDGTLFTMTPQGTLTTLWQFNNLVDGNGPSGLIQGSGSNRYFFGVTNGGGPKTNGTVFAFRPGGGTLTYTTLHAFSGATNDGAYPSAITLGRDGNLYGVASYGGLTGTVFGESITYGVLFTLSTNVSTNAAIFKVLYRFTNGLDGFFPVGALTQGSGNDTNFYGTTVLGGTNHSCLGGCGTAFRMTPTGTMTNLHCFSSSEGGWPYGTLLLGANSNFYGTAFTGGSNGAGTVFMMTPQGAVTKLSVFGNQLGGGPDSGMLQGFDSNSLYGTTVSAGYGYGTVFRVTPQGTLTTLWAFHGPPDGGMPYYGDLAAGLVQGTNDGYLYGVTLVGGTSTDTNCWDGCGTAFKLNPATYGWSITNGTIIGPTNTPSIQWTTTGTNLVKICVTATDSPVCTQQVCTTVIPYTGAIAAGGISSVAVRPDGTLWTWGGNDGELGDGLDSVVRDAGAGWLVLEEYRPYPGEVADITSCFGQTINSPVAVAAGGDDYTVVVDSAGRVWTFGENSGGQLGTGIGALGDTNQYPVPTRVTGVTNVVSVAAGFMHTLALCADGTVWAWGYDNFGAGEENDNFASGALGAGYNVGFTNSPIQSLVPSGTIIVGIAAGDGFSLAVDTTGNVWGWGDNEYGEIGTNVASGIVGTNQPVIVPGVSNVIAIAAGANAFGNDQSIAGGGHSIALTADRRVWTWGNNSLGQLGRNAGTFDPLPGLVTALTNQTVVAIAGGVGFTLAVTSNGQVYAWGDNAFGELGTETSAIPSTSNPMLVPGINNAVLVSAPRTSDGLCNLPIPNGYEVCAKYPNSANAYLGGVHVVAMTVDGGANHYWGWGDNSYGQVGNDVSGGATNRVSQYTPAGPLQFCTRCQRCVQLGTSGILTAQCTGTLTLYLNEEQGKFYNDTNAFIVTIDGLVTNKPVPPFVHIDPDLYNFAGVSMGFPVGMVTNGGIYSFHASGYCQYDTRGDQVNPDGIDLLTTNLVDCSDFSIINKTNAVCPTWRCFSLVGKIQ